MFDEMNNIQKNILSRVAGITDTPVGAYNIRVDGKALMRASSENISITPKADGTGIDILIREGTKNESVHIPVVLSKSGIEENVYNDFIIGDDCDVTIIAGCGIHNDNHVRSKHDGIHRFHVGKNAKIKYVEKHYGTGDGTGERIMNPETVVIAGENSSIEMEMVQIKGVDSTTRTTKATLDKNAKLVIIERLMTHGSQYAKSEFDINLNGDGCSTSISSRSVAKDNSTQLFYSRINGNAVCSGHSECDAIIVGNAKISAIPEITANCSDAALIHEAAIGKIAGEQILKLMTLGLTESEAEEQIINGFLK